jgi:predicted transcriptional regulator YdeE
MQKTTVSCPDMKLVGITVRTNNEIEKSVLEGKIFPCIQKFFHQAYPEKIDHRTKMGTTLCVYTDYESDYTGDYTYFIGEEVSSFEEQPEEMVQLTLPAQTYTKFTNGPAPMPEVVRGPWFKIWQMSPEELGGERAYKADFEVYDERATDHDNIVLDIYIGIKE